MNLCIIIHNNYTNITMKLFSIFSSLLSFPIEYGKTHTHLIKNINGFGNLPETTVANIYKDGRPFAHFIEPWLASNYPLLHVKGCKSYDHINAIDSINTNTNKNTNAKKYEQKTFTQHGCNFAPSYMVGKSRTFNKKICEEKANELIFIIVSNIYFPEIKVKFVKGSDLIEEYPKAFIPRRDYDRFFM